MSQAFHSRAIVTAIAIGAAVFWAGLAMGTASAQGDPLLGCWRHESKQGKYTNFLEVCLGEGRKAEFVEFDNGNGRGRKARWEIIDGSTLSLAFASDDKLRCQFSLIGSSKLALKDCSISDYSRDLTRENVSADRGTRQSICWGRDYPNNDDFEVAEITKRTPAIVELQHKQVDQDDADAEAGTIVVVKSRSGQYACVENPTSIPDSYFWVDQNALKAIPASNSEENLWVGKYSATTTIEITFGSGGGYDVYGINNHTHGHGPGWGYTISNEIFAREAKPQQGFIQVALRRDVTTAGPKAPKNLTNPGFVDDQCKPVLFVKGPVLLIKDIGSCGDGSVFQGYWLR